MRCVLDGMSVGLVTMSAVGRITWVNRAAARILGVEQEACYGKLLAHVIRDPNLAEFWHAAREHGQPKLADVSVHWPRPAELKLNAACCVSDDGEPIGRALLFYDVTHERSVQVELSQEMASRLAGLMDTPPASVTPAAGLTPQELRVLRLVGSGVGNEKIADELSIAPSTVRSHMKHIYRKLKLRSRAEVVHYAVRNQLA